MNKIIKIQNNTLWTYNICSEQILFKNKKRHLDSYIHNVFIKYVENLNYEVQFFEDGIKFQLEKIINVVAFSKDELLDICIIKTTRNLNSNFILWWGKLEIKMVMRKSSIAIF